LIRLGGSVSEVPGFCHSAQARFGLFVRVSVGLGNEHQKVVGSHLMVEGRVAHQVADAATNLAELLYDVEPVDFFIPLYTRMLAKSTLSYKLSERSSGLSHCNAGPNRILNP
jgi:hypothetical protein